MWRTGLRVDDFRMIVFTSPREAAFREFSDAAFTVHPSDGDEVGMHCHCGEYVYEHEKVSARAEVAQPCLHHAGTNTQSVMDCRHGALKEVT